MTTPPNITRAFSASPLLSASLQAVLVDIIELQMQAKEAHWNVVGANFRDLHQQLDEVAEASRGFSDHVAKRMRALWAVPDGRTSTVAATTSLPPYPQGEICSTDTVEMITTRIDAVVSTARRVHDDVDAEDPTSADLLHSVIGGLEQLAWMMSAENRRVRQR